MPNTTITLVGYVAGYTTTVYQAIRNLSLVTIPILYRFQLLSLSISSISLPLFT